MAAKECVSGPLKLGIHRYLKELLEVGEDPSSSVANDEVQVSDMAEAASTLRMSYVSYCSDPIPAITQVRARFRSNRAVTT